MKSKKVMSMLLGGGFAVVMASPVLAQSNADPAKTPPAGSAQQLQPSAAGSVDAKSLKDKCHKEAEMQGITSKKDVDTFVEKCLLDSKSRSK